MARQRPKLLRQSEWDPRTAKYADLSSPEWLDRVPNKFWDDPRNHKRYMKWLALKLKIKKPSDWYRVRSKDFTNNHGNRFLTYYDSPGNFIHAIKAHNPRYKFLEWQFPITPTNFWKDRKNRLRYREWLGQQLGFKETRDWYALDKHMLLELGGSGLMDMFGCSPQRIVKDFFPNTDWNTWQFRQARSGFWKTKKNRREYLQWLEKRLGLKKPDDWYTVRLRDFYQNFGSALMQYNGNRSFDTVLKDLYPGRKWQQWKFSQVSKGFWNTKKNRLEYLHWLGDKCGFKTFDDWLKLQSKHFLSNHGYQPYFMVYENDLSRPVKELFPGKDCHPWMFRNTTDGYWNQPANRTAYVKWLGKRMGFRKNTDWYTLRPKDFHDNHGRNLCNKYGPISDLVMEAFPDRELYPWLFTRVPRGYWHGAKNRGVYFDWLGKQLKIKKASDWDDVDSTQVAEHGGSTLLQTVFRNRKSDLLASAKRRFRQSTH